MTEANDINREVLAAQIALRLAGPASAIVGFQTLIVENIRGSGLSDVIGDAEMVLQAAHELEQKISDLLSPDGIAVGNLPDGATLRHDLRTPVNAILGYSEMILEEQADALDETLGNDIAVVISECGHVLDQIDSLVDFSSGKFDAVVLDESDAGIAEALAHTLADIQEISKKPCGRILVIDDIEANRELLRRNLTSRGHTVMTASSARDALRLLETSDFELALVDILMPDMNGIELLSVLKADRRWRDMAIVMISGLKHVKAVVKCIKAGAADYLEKPVDPVLLHARVESCLENVRWRARERQFLEKIEFEKSRADRLLLSMLPDSIIRRLGKGERVIADRFESATIIFADIVDFTPLVARMDPSELVSHLHDMFSTFDTLADRHGIEKIKTIGDAYMAVAGVPEAREDHAECALAFCRDLIRVQSSGRDTVQPLKIRIGVSTGPIIAGLIGQKRFVYDVWGETVNLASRLESSGEAGRIHMSGSTLSSLKSRPFGLSSSWKTIKGVGQIETFLVD